MTKSPEQISESIVFRFIDKSNPDFGNCVISGDADLIKNAIAKAIQAERDAAKGLVEACIDLNAELNSRRLDYNCLTGEPVKTILAFKKALAAYKAAIGEGGE